jgi:hypothetical protein
MTNSRLSDSDSGHNVSALGNGLPLDSEDDAYQTESPETKVNEEAVQLRHHC